MKTHAEYEARKAQDAFKQKIINDIINKLIGHENARLKELVSGIINDHVKLTGTDGFYYRGNVYTNVMGASFATLQKLPIHDSLKDRMQEYIKQVQEIDADRAKIAQGLAVLLRQANSYQSVRNALPELLIPCTSWDVSSLSRQTPEAAGLTSKLHIQQYEKTKDMLYFYLGSRLLG